MVCRIIFDSIPCPMVSPSFRLQDFTRRDFGTFRLNELFTLIMVVSENFKDATN